MSAVSSKPMIIVHDLAQAKAALAAAGKCSRSVVLRSSETTSGASGPGLFVEIAAMAREYHPQNFAGALFDCGTEAGLAMAAIRRGDCHIIIDLAPKTAAKIMELAQACGTQAFDRTEIESTGEPVLDLLDAHNAFSAVKKFLETAPL